MTEKELRQVIREEIKSSKKEAKTNFTWKTQNLDKEFYNFWADLDLTRDRFSDYMNEANKGKLSNAAQSLKNGFENLLDVKKGIDKTIALIKKELSEQNFLKQGK